MAVTIVKVLAGYLFVCVIMYLAVLIHFRMEMQDIFWNGWDLDRCTPIYDWPIFLIPGFGVIYTIASFKLTTELAIHKNTPGTVLHVQVMAWGFDYTEQD